MITNEEYGMFTCLMIMVDILYFTMVLKVKVRTAA